MRWLLAIGLCAACTDNTVVVTPIIDIPANDTAQAIGLDSITLSIAHAGAADDITSATFSHGDVLELLNVPFGDDLVVHMSGRIGTSDFAYGRTCQFSVRPDARLPAPHLFFSRLVKFGELSQQPLPRLGGTAMMYRDGTGLLIGGSYPDENGQPLALTQIERFDPNGGDYDNLHDIERRYDAAAAILGTGPDSRVVIVGGRDPLTNIGADFVEVIEAERNTDRQYERFFEPSMNRIGLTATTLSDGRVVVIGGRCADPTMCSVERANPSSVQEIAVDTGTTAVRQLQRATLTYPRYAHTATRLTNELGAAVLVAGGLDPVTNKPVARAQLYKPLAEDFADPTTFTAEMKVPRWQHQAVRLPDGSVLFIGGLTIGLNPDTMLPETQVVSTLELFSPLDATFLDVGTLPATAGRVGISATVLPDGRVLISGGQITIGGPPVNSAFIARLDPLDGTVDIVATDRLAVPRSGHQATLLCDGTVLISGGTMGQSSFERYNPPALGRR
ncbi:MAG TPA: hypothetical protein VIV40_16535 [Kofleriaceae bacterium]